ncbi:MAG: hypothetical protein IPK84_02895 [Candidatus Moraniibacteriota bacterium]|nr:MAG: hypothetical protein IPK84_02895 [Candidatus Moranbacteria bacterium]
MKNQEHLNNEGISFVSATTASAFYRPNPGAATLDMSMMTNGNVSGGAGLGLGIVGC